MVRKIVMIRIYVLVLLAVVLAFTMTAYFISQQRLPQPNSESFQQRYSEVKKLPAEKLTLFHLDLKGAPPKLSYLYEIMPIVQKAGANGILIEYEDMFPWSGSLNNVSALNAYKKEELQTFLRNVTEMGMEIIPLVQTFGHLEFILKLEEFRHLREVDSFPQEICPSKHDSFLLVKEMIRQIFEFHKNARYIHIGCDEVYHLASCQICSRKTGRSVFTAHVKKVASYIKSAYPGATVIIWDDMLRKWPPTEIQKSHLGDLVEPMVWVYIQDIPRLVPHYIWYVYKKTFRNLWAASAFKGAFGEWQVVPDMQRHLDNNLAWHRLMSPRLPHHSVLDASDFRGLAVTGWSRYDHFAVLSELLPVSLPSLILSLTLASHYQSHATDQFISNTAISEMIKILQCPAPFASKTLADVKKGALAFGQCNYPGSDAYQLVSEYKSIATRGEVVARERTDSGWISDYSLRYQYSSPYRLVQLFPEEGFAAQRLHNDVMKLQQDIEETFELYYDKWTIDEWLEQHLNPLEKWLTDLENSLTKLLQVKNWPRRPLVLHATEGK